MQTLWEKFKPGDERRAAETSRPDDNSDRDATQTKLAQQSPGSMKDRSDIGPTLSERLKIPEELPGANVPPISLPVLDAARPEAREQAIDQLFPKLEKVNPGLSALVVSGQNRLTLDDLQSLALGNNPLIAQANAEIEAALGAAIQAGLHPNPTVGYEADTVGSNGTRNYQGVYFTQVIKTAGKLQLARSAAEVDWMNAQLAAQKTRVNLLTRVRAAYFSVLVAAENVKVSDALVRFTNEVYQVQVEQLRGGQAAAYEPMQLRALASQARAALALALNRYDAAWRQLAAVLGVPDLPPTELDGSAEMALPDIPYDTALEHMLCTHTDLLQACNLEVQARIKLRLAEVTPFPDVDVYSAIQRDYTTPPVLRTTYNLQVGVPVPIFDRNQGGIRQAEGHLVRAAEEHSRVRIELTTQFADAFERYQNNRRLIETYRTHIIPDQSRAYRAIYERHQQEPERVGFGDVVVAQQQLLTSITSYISALGAQWTAINDLANLLQVESMEELTARVPAEVKEG